MSNTLQGVLAIAALLGFLAAMFWTGIQGQVDQRDGGDDGE
jgi:hypothetical protein